MDKGFIEYWKKLIGQTIEYVKNLPSTMKQLLAMVWLFILGNYVPWKDLLGDMGGNIQAGFILGAIFLLIKLLKTWNERSEKPGKEKS